MRLDGGPSLPGVIDPAGILPSHFSKNYPILVEFLEIYSSFLYDPEISTGEIQALLEDESWWDKRDDYFETPEERFFVKVMDLQKLRSVFGFEQAGVSLIEGKGLDTARSVLISLDGFALGSSDLREMNASSRDEFHVSSWLADKGLAQPDFSSKFDDGLFIEIARHLFKIRGSMECARIFFEAAYGGTANVFLPRTKISALDDNMVLDGDTHLRDDWYYDEFTYVVNLIGSDYLSIGDKYFKLWKERFHPGGFRCVFNHYTEEEWLLVGENWTLPDKIGVWKQFFEGPFSSIFTRLFPV